MSRTDISDFLPAARENSRDFHPNQCYSHPVRKKQTIINWSWLILIQSSEVSFRRSA